MIDAGFLKRKLGSQQSPMTASRVYDFTETVRSHPALAGLVLHRIYYYDAEPLSLKKPIPLTGGKKNWRTRDFSQNPLHDANMQLLDELKQKPFFAVRLGETQFRGWIVKPALLKADKTDMRLDLTAADLIPNIQQKGVDMRIGLDISSLSLKNQADVIVLVTGDSDFIPAMKFARREGKQIFLFSLGHAVKNEMYAHTDMCIDTEAKDL